MKGANKLAGYFAKKLGYKLLNDMKPAKQTVLDELRHFINTGADELPPVMEQITFDEIGKMDRTKVLKWQRDMYEYKRRNGL